MSLRRNANEFTEWVIKSRIGVNVWLNDIWTQAKKEDSEESEVEWREHPNPNRKWSEVKWSQRLLAFDWRLESGL